MVTPDTERVAIRRQAEVAGVGAALAGARVDVRVYIDQAGRDVESRDVDHLQSGGRVQVLRDGRDRTVLDRDIADGADIILRIDDVAALQQQVVCRLAEGWTGHANQGRQTG